MILEVAVLQIRPGQSKAFETDFRTASQYIRSIPGYLTHRLHKCVENKDQYLLLAEWETLETHEVGFRQSEAYKKWKALLHHYYDPFPIVEHYEEVPL